VAAQILGAEAGALAAMREQGFFYAERRNRDAVADLEAATIEVESTFHTGRIHRFGPITVTGAPNVDTDYVLTYVPWGPGELATRDQMRDLQQSLLATGLFRSGTVTLPDEAPEDETAPVTITLEEGPFRSVSAGVRFNTDDGPGGRVTFEHRNLFGANERLRLTLDADLDEQRFEIGYRKPQFFKRDGQEFGAGLELRRVEDDAFDELGATLTVGVSRKLGEKWTLGGGGLLEFSDIEDNAIDTTAQLAGLPFFAEYDGSNDLLNPTTGIRWRLDLTPFVGRFNEAFTAFTVIDTRVSHYLPLDEAARYVVATRGRVGFIPSDAFDEVPQTRLLYAGGSGSVRAFAEDFVGALDDEGDPVGGRSAVEAGVELRFPIWGDLGGVAFVEGGAVADNIVPNFENTFLFGAGGGLRYFSPVGPIRLDVAVPVNGRDEDDAFQFYISIGQAF
ncbi:MAG: BamA/TamA family outer membrane protein, partial [Pseudomonadota bacterium]